MNDGQTTRAIHVIDSHTAGEPTRVVTAGGPELGDGSLSLRRERFAAEFDQFRSAIVNEPRGSEVLVGAMLCPPVDPTCAAGVIFFNNVGYLGMCGHGAIGVMATLAHLGQVHPGPHRLETPVGVVRAMLHGDGSVTLENVASYRRCHDFTVDVPEIGIVQGDVAWGGNWFFLVDAQFHRQPLCFANLDRLADLAGRIRDAVNQAGLPEVDHVELFGPAEPTLVGDPPANSRSFVLCPGRAYDRSPCGTGTSAKLACLAADGKLRPGEPWVQESVLGTRFVGEYRWADFRDGDCLPPHELASKPIIPSITGRAFVVAESRLLLDEADPFCWGIH